MHTKEKPKTKWPVRLPLIDIWRILRTLQQPNVTKLPFLTKITIFGQKKTAIWDLNATIGSVDHVQILFNGWQLAKIKKGIPDMSLP